MTEQQIDRERRAMWRQIATDAGDDPYVNTLHPDEALALLDQLEQAEAELDSWMTRAYEAEQRAWQAEARLQAVRDVLSHHPYGGPEQEDATRRALEGSATRNAPG